jgi:AcrR family transcriptional regulator
LVAVVNDAMPEGLRERKKARTRAELQRHALRLFRDRGYAATTVDDIAAAAEVSRSTFFRYFPTKEEVVFFDDVDPLFDEVFAALPAGTPMLTALRETVRSAFSRLDAEKRALEEVRMQLARSVPEIAATLRARNAWGIEQMAAVTAGALGRDRTDPEVLVFAGVVTGARLAAQALVEADPSRSYVQTLDAVLEHLVEGVPLADAPILGATPGSGSL